MVTKREAAIQADSWLLAGISIPQNFSRRLAQISRNCVEQWLDCLVYLERFFIHFHLGGILWVWTMQ
ncbi:hypothetical protein GCM10010913_16700 [Paenibacillus aceti]|uniref:Uncharacterized protein n=1 Tax=Paenibacillus aceti TaxID=1820010 RepID=A0ABQ1VSP7_9BACL|nr:hypothetical protein GCM10010913_16700 [Paenibacillus aceti]